MKQFFFFLKKKKETSDTKVLGIYLCGCDYQEDPGSQFGLWQQCGGMSDVIVQMCATQVNLVTLHFNKEVSI